MKWRKKVEEDICTLEQLKEFVDLTPKEKRQLREITKIHPMRLTRYYLSLIAWDDPVAPIR